MTVTDDRLTGTRTNRFPMQSRLYVPRERYYDREFFELEKERLWRHTWQMACRLEEIPEVGDYIEYVICDQSILVVRQSEDRIRAFFNACRHRATELLKGSGSLLGGQIVCPFHGWRWNADGSSSFIYGEEAFEAECLKPDDIKLQECRSDIWGGCVWINLDDEASPLHEMLAPATRYLDPLGFADMRVWWWKEVVLDVNWKMAMEAFLEGYHTMRTHTQLTMGMGEEWPAGTISYETFDHGHSRFWMGGEGTSEPMPADLFIEFARVLWEGQDAMTLERDIRVFESIRHRPEAQLDAAPVAIAALYDYAQGAGIPLPVLTPEQMSQWGGEVFLFPNFFVLPQYGNALSYRCRPHEDNPEKCRFEVWSLTLYPEDQEPGRAHLKGRFAQDDAENWGMIPRQDFSNMERQQRGLHSDSFQQLRLATNWEGAIANLHYEVDRYIEHYQ
jgi:phenylpropionate dioxygenase-like ring-hydroxylating dioxygenase large terminal subunit